MHNKSNELDVTPADRIGCLSCSLHSQHITCQLWPKHTIMPCSANNYCLKCFGSDAGLVYVGNYSAFTYSVS